ncbi:PP2C family protein-serine/threonine phosphatase [Kitasatospora cineracea]|uniref:PP2C family protein-serine/threonine phosphatase n=1 Tax=Kitasatospora cineracea TaxID=88074 RepID=UPI0036C18B74
MNRPFALAVDPDGQVDELVIPEGHVTGQHRILHTHLGKGYSTIGLGRLLVHCPNTPYEQHANIPAQRLWTALAGGASAPFFRGTVIVTGRRLPDGTYPRMRDGQIEELARNVHPTSWEVPTRPEISAAQLRGVRWWQCDAFAVHADAGTGTWAFVVCDGLGDLVEAQMAAHHFSQRIAIVAAETGDPEAAVYAARGQLAHWTWNFCVEGEPTSTVAVAVWNPRKEEVLIAWAGNSRVYAQSPTGVVEQLTVDHTMAEYKKAHGAPVRDGDEHQLLAHLEEGPVEVVRVHRERASKLLLCTNGTYESIESHRRHGMYATFSLMPPKEAAGALVAEGVSRAIARSEDAQRERDADNATALVVDFAGL